MLAFKSGQLRVIGHINLGSLKLVSRIQTLQMPCNSKKSVQMLLSWYILEKTNVFYFHNLALVPVHVSTILDLKGIIYSNIIQTAQHFIIIVNV